MLVLVQNKQGYLNLSELLARAWTKNVVKKPGGVHLGMAGELSEGLVALSGRRPGLWGRRCSKGMKQELPAWR